MVVLPNLYFFTLEDGTCKSIGGELEEWMGVYQKTINYALFSGGPFILISVSNLVFIHNLYQIRKEKQARLDLTTRVIAENSCRPVSSRMTKEATSYESGSASTRPLLTIAGNDTCRHEKESKYVKKELEFPAVDHYDDLVTEVYCGPKTSSYKQKVQQPTEPFPCKQSTSDKEKIEDFEITNKETYDFGKQAKAGSTSMPVFRVTDFLTNGETQSTRKIQVSGSASLMQAELSVSTPQKSNGVVHISSRESERRGELTGSQDIEDKEEETPKNDSSVVIMLLVVCCSYLVLTAFAAFFNVLGTYDLLSKKVTLRKQALIFHFFLNFRAMFHLTRYRVPQPSNFDEFLLSEYKELCGQKTVPAYLNSRQKTQ